MTIDAKVALALHDELWKLRERTYDIQDKQIGIILNRYGRILQDIIAYLPKEEFYDDTEESEKEND